MTVWAGLGVPAEDRAPGFSEDFVKFGGMGGVVVVVVGVGQGEGGEVGFGFDGPVSFATEVLFPVEKLGLIPKLSGGDGIAPKSASSQTLDLVAERLELGK